MRIRAAGAIVCAIGVALMSVTGLSAQQLGSGFGEITLGTSLDQVMRELDQSEFFAFDADNDISIVPLSRNALVSVRGTDHIEQGFFQFDTDALVSIQLVLNQNSIDHFTLYGSLVEKYGEPHALTPQLVTWESEAVRISIERPLILKYIDMQYFSSQQGARRERASTGTIDEFLRQL